MLEKCTFDYSTLLFITAISLFFFVSGIHVNSLFLVQDLAIQLMFRLWDYHEDPISWIFLKDKNFHGHWLICQHNDRIHPKWPGLPAYERSDQTGSLLST